jgi:hemerythrin-like domain-containing protein
MIPMGWIDRRRFISGATATLTGAIIVGCRRSDEAESGEGRSAASGDEDEISPTEDLMREHGVLRRVLLIYDEAERRLEGHEPLDSNVVVRAAGIIQRFIEGYHEKQEEEHLFPAFEKAGKMVELVTVLRRQHEAGRAATAEILGIAQHALTSEDDKAKLVVAMRRFSRMYRPHAAREDTELFPALKGVVGEKQLERMGELFEKREHELFGEKGFENVVGEVSVLEEVLGIHDLARFTP